MPFKVCGKVGNESVFKERTDKVAKGCMISFYICTTLTALLFLR